ncbi:hypothetical protein [Oribacterium sp. FC2011]|uniref:hypothetical protein n=1 Tax=Oribacterium sp. FC2011 TaxID=1408311 RepID=UPI0006790D99|nr:hypothetical protein [Oribacterium sp. FC2011]
MRKVILTILTVIIAIVACFTALAGTWKSDSNGWWYDEGNGSYPKNTWSWIDGNDDGVSECYYFNENGYCLINTITPDNYYVNPSGAWVENGIVQTKDTGVSAGTEALDSVDVVSGSNKTSSKSDNSNSNKKNMLESDPEISYQFFDNSEYITLSGDNWKGGAYFYTSDWYPESYAEFYLGKKYKKLTIKATPFTKNYRYSMGVKTELIVSNAETEEVLFTKEITETTKKFTIEADVTDVDYIRFDYRMTYRGESVVPAGSLLIKDAILTM